jgi:hypothetical protein
VVERSEGLKRMLDQHYLLRPWVDRARSTRDWVVHISQVARAIWQLGVAVSRREDAPFRLESMARPIRRPTVSVSLSRSRASLQHATASQVYHAALGESNELDVMLDRFEYSGESDRGGQANGGLLCGTEACQCCKRYAQHIQDRNSSIQSTPEQMRTPLGLCSQGPFQSSGQQDVFVHRSTGGTAPVDNSNELSNDVKSNSTANLLDLEPRCPESPAGLPERQYASTNAVATSHIALGCSKERLRQSKSVSRMSHRGSRSEHHSVSRDRHSDASMEVSDSPLRRNKLQKQSRGPQKG